VVTSPGARSPIGVFDSGIGGLTVVHELRTQLPEDRLIYFGDTARVPYGPKSPDTVRRYAAEITEWLVAQGVKAVVVACNTATAHALPSLRERFAIPIIGVIEPGAAGAARASRSGRIGVIGTSGTVASGAYERAIRALRPDTHVISRACPLFVPLVEEGWLDAPATQLIAHEYLDPLAAERIDTLVLGCTHYPLLKPLLARVVGASVRLIDSAEETAAATRAALEQASLRAPAGGKGDCRFVASDAPDQFLRVGQRFLGDAVGRVEKVTLG
jgi:glutamate racemase